MTPTVRWLLVAHLLYLGAGYTFGPAQWSSSGTFAVIRSAGIPIFVWGAVFLAAGALLALGVHRAGHALAAFVFTFWGFGLAATIVTGDIAGWGGPGYVLLLVAPLHFLGLWRHTTGNIAAVRHQQGG